jgi:hypothetical protein
MSSHLFIYIQPSLVLGKMQIIQRYQEVKVAVKNFKSIIEGGLVEQMMLGPKIYWGE